MIDDIFRDDSDGKAIALIESLRQLDPKDSNTVEKKGTNLTWK
jgi:hypothetical protein